MADWNPEEPLPDQIADAFAALYDWFEDHHMDDVRKSQWADSVDRYFDRTALQRAVEATEWDTPVLLRQQITDARAVGPTRTALAVYACLLAIDDGLADIHPRMALAGPIWDHYELNGRYNDAYHGYVLPAWTRPYRGAKLSSHVRWLCRARVDRDRVQVIRLNSRAPAVREEESQTIAIAPFLYQLEGVSGTVESDTRFCGRSVADKHYFEVHHLDSDPVGLSDRVYRTVAAFREARATIAIFPELALNHVLLGVLRDALAATAEDESVLRWVIAGHYEPKVDGPDDVPSDFLVFNAAVVLDQFGNVVGERPETGEPGWVQRKRHPYKLTIGEQERYGIETIFDERHDREEAISLGNRVLVLEGRSGRTAVMICEDFGQEDRTCAELRRMGCSLVVVILMDGPVARGRWAPAKAHAFVDQTGARVLIANSLALPNLPKCVERTRRDTGRDSASGGRCHVGYIVEPPAGDLDPTAPDPRYLTSDEVPGMNLDSLISTPQPIVS